MLCCCSFEGGDSTSKPQQTNPKTHTFQSGSSSPIPQINSNDGYTAASARTNLPYSINLSLLCPPNIHLLPLLLRHPIRLKHRTQKVQPLRRGFFGCILVVNPNGCALLCSGFHGETECYCCGEFVHPFLSWEFCDYVGD